MRRPFRKLAACTALAGSLAAGIVPVFAQPRPNSLPVVWRSVRVGGHVWGRLPVIQQNPRTFIGVWYFLRLLRSNGISADWNGKVLSAAGLPVYHSAAHTTVDGRTYPLARTLSVAGNLYVDVTAISPAFRWIVRYDASVHCLALTTSTYTHDAVQPGRFASLRPHFDGDPANVQFSTRDSIGPEPVAARLEGSLPQHRTQTNGATSTVQTGQARIAGGPSAQEIVVDGQAYVDAAAVLRWLHDSGYRVQWRAAELDIAALPMVYQDATLAVDGVRVPSTIVRFQQDWYVPLSTLMSAAGVVAGANSDSSAVIERVVANAPAPVPVKPGRTFVASGRVAGVHRPGAKVLFLNVQNELTVQPVDAKGGFVAHLPGNQATLVGVYTPQTGWVGQGIHVTAGSPGLVVSATPEMSRVIGRIAPDRGGRPVSRLVIDLRSDLTHAHYTVETDARGAFRVTLPAGPYEVWTITVAGTPVFVGKRFVAQPGTCTIDSLSLPPVPQGPVYRSTHALVAAQTADVPPLQLVNVANLFERAFSADLALTGIRPQVPVVIEVFGNTKEYTQHFRDEGYAGLDAESYGMSSQAASESPQTIVLNLDGLDSEWGSNVMAHEFGHCLLATLSNHLPDWVNEGIAWELGISAEADQTPNSLIWSSLRWGLWADVVRHTADLYPLGQADSLAPRYNIEAQDDFAVYRLIQEYGMAKVLQYVRTVDRMGQKAAFRAVFGQTYSAYAAAVNRTLAKIAAGSDGPIRVTVRAYPGAARQVFISAPSGRTIWYSGVKPGLYTFVLRPNGVIVAPRSLRASAPVMSPADGTWDIGAQRGGVQGLVAVSRLFSTAYVESATVFPAGSDDGTTTQSTAVPLGIEVIGIAALP